MSLPAQGSPWSHHPGPPPSRGLVRLRRLPVLPSPGPASGPHRDAGWGSEHQRPPPLPRGPLFLLHGTRCQNSFIFPEALGARKTHRSSSRCADGAVPFLSPLPHPAPSGPAFAPGSPCLQHLPFGSSLKCALLHGGGRSHTCAQASSLFTVHLPILLAPASPAPPEAPPRRPRNSPPPPQQQEGARPAGQGGSGSDRLSKAPDDQGFVVNQASPTRSCPGPLLRLQSQ